ncbi:hypothetical protein DYQ86_08590 [Acidobacteria bacterium AB60]|nr:hypothetical protein DYQ86_08590 [Acidobacteria bacterium AB60]
MTPPTSPAKPSTWPIAIGAEGIAAAQFARCGFDVMMQVGRDKPWYDFAVTRAGNMLKVSVKPSEDGRWNLAQGFGRRSSEPGTRALDCRSAIDMWADSQGSKTICCLVQFEDVAISQMPRIYLAYPAEIAAEMKLAAERTGCCGLAEQYEYTTEGKREFASLPAKWRFSAERIQELLEGQTSASASSVISGSFPKPGPVMVTSVAARPVAMTA